jgi:transcriptional regulator with XRE-family HTH domain
MQETLHTRTATYDRTLLHERARRLGDANSNQMANRLGLDRATAWRLWKGKVTPTAPVLAAVHEHYGLTAGDLIRRP